MIRPAVWYRSIHVSERNGFAVFRVDKQSFTLERETINSSEMWTDFYHITRRHTPADFNLFTYLLTTLPAFSLCLSCVGLLVLAHTVQRSAIVCFKRKLRKVRTIVSCDSSYKYPQCVIFWVLMASLLKIHVSSNIMPYQLSTKFWKSVAPPFSVYSLYELSLDRRILKMDAQRPYRTLVTT